MFLKMVLKPFFTAENGNDLLFCNVKLAQKYPSKVIFGKEYCASLLSPINLLDMTRFTGR